MIPLPPFTTRPEIKGHFGVVTTTHWIASAIGMSVLEKGGNAFDAAVTAGFALQVLEPHLNGPGGEFPAIFWARSDGRPRVLCAQGPAPALATIPAFEAMGLGTVPGSGLLPAVVPGAFDGWMRLLLDYGTISLRAALEPVIAYGEMGIPVVPRMAQTISEVHRLFNDQWPTSAAVFLDKGNVPAVGSWFRNPRISATYRRLLDEAEAKSRSREGQIEAARKIWSEGFIAEAIDRFYHTERLLDPSGQKHGGLLRGDDLARWTATYEEPVSIEYGRHTVCKAGFWSQGPVLLQQLAILKQMGLSEMPATSARFVHTVTEAAKLAFADREAWYGDPSFVDVPQATLLSDAYAAERRKLISDRASLDLRPGSPDRRTPDVEVAFTAPKTIGEIGEYWSVGEPTTKKTGETRGDTVHLDIIDREGNMISMTPSGGWLQSAPVIPELGFPMSNRGQMFWLDERSPSSLAPLKRPRTTLSPCLALRDGEPYIVWGTPGGDQQDQWSTLLFLHHVEHGMNLQESIDAPAFHSEHFPGSFWPRGCTPGRLVVEGRFPKATQSELIERGHLLEAGGDWSEGRLTAAAREPDGILKAAANPRGMQGYAVGR